MKRLVIDASIAIKWVVEEAGTAEALALYRSAILAAPDLLLAECANILWKKVRRRELSKAEAVLAGRVLLGADIELVPARSLFEAAITLAIELDHPAYDCVYVALALERDCEFATADQVLLRKVETHSAYRDRVVSLTVAADPRSHF